MATAAVVGMGEMGACLARSLREAGLRVVTCLEGRGPESRRRAAAAGAEDLPLADAVADADLFLSVLPPARALDLAEAVAAAPVAHSLLYVDCNAISPATAERVAAIVTGAGARFADVGIIGVPPRPVLYASGEAAGDLVDLAGGALDVRELGGPAGRASALKMCYAAFTKGTTALATELLVAARRLGVAAQLRAELGASAPHLLALAERTIPAMPPKAYRWIGEMEEIAATFSSVGLTPRILLGAAELYRMVEKAGGRPAATLDEVLGELA